MRRVIDLPPKKAILVLPYVALVQEKLRLLRKLVDQVQKKIENASGPGLAHGPGPWEPANIRVVGFYGGTKTRADWRDFDIAVCTIEKVRLR